MYCITIKGRNLRRIERFYDNYYFEDFKVKVIGFVYFYLEIVLEVRF